MGLGGSEGQMYYEGSKGSSTALETGREDWCLGTVRTEKHSDMQNSLFKYLQDETKN